jgi:hypothetical protein
MSKEQICGNCVYKGYKVPGCYFGGNPNNHEKCIHPGKFWAKTLPEGYELETPTEWHLTGYKPKVEKVAVPGKGKRKSKVARDTKTGRFVKK